MKKTQTLSIVAIVIVTAILAALLLYRGSKPTAPEQATAAESKQQDHDDEDKVRLNAEQIQAAGIRLARVEPATIATTASFPGEIRFNDDRLAHVVPRVAGIVESAPALLGQAVTKGQLLATVASSVVSDLRSELSAAQKRLELARTTLSRERKLWEEKISAEQDYLQARNAQNEAEIAVTNARQKLQATGIAGGQGGNRIELRAPFDGVIMEKHATLGESVREDTALFTVADLTSVWANFNVAAKDIEVVQTGKRATVQASATSSKAEGTVSYVGSLLGEQTRTATARVTLQNPQGAWRPGLFVTVLVEADRKSAALTVPNDALQNMNGKQVVFTRTPDGFEAKPVQTGVTDGIRTEILEGVAAGDDVAGAGSFVVKAELNKAAASDSH